MLHYIVLHNQQTKCSYVMALYDFIYTGKVSDDLLLSESATFNENYALLCNTINDIVDPLTECFVEENLFATEEQKQISKITSASDKIKILLLSISNSLNANNTRGFYMMLKIMKEYGGRGTLMLADHIMNRVKVSADKSFHICVDHDDIEVQNDEPES